MEKKKIILIEKETTNEIVAYMIIDYSKDNFGLTDKEFIESGITVAIDDGILEENIYYRYYQVDKLPKLSKNVIRI